MGDSNGSAPLEQTVRQVLTEMRLLDGHGRIRSLDSLEILELLEQLEKMLGYPIPPEHMTANVFSSVGSLVTMLETARGRQ